MLRVTSRIVAATALLAAVASCTSDATGPQAQRNANGTVSSHDAGGGGITLTITVPEKTSTDLGIDETLALGYTLTNPAGHVIPSNRPISWSSSDVDVATVSDDGVVTGVDAGEATITAAGGHATGSLLVTVCGGKEAADPGAGEAPKGAGAAPAGPAAEPAPPAEEGGKDGPKKKPCPAKKK